VFKDYYELTKPGIIYGNALSLIAGFAMASSRVISQGGHSDPWLFGAALFGLSLVIASGCVFNNYIDRDIDGAMERTKNRPLVKGRVSNTSAILYATCLGILGFFFLARYTNFLTTGVAVLGFIFYVGMYSLWGKRRTVYGTLIGSVSGAVPPVVGYTAVSGRLDVGALLLFLILVFWQMPHFFAIAIRRSKDYAAAAIPVLPLTSGIKRTKIVMAFCISAFVGASMLLAVFGYVGIWYIALAAVLGCVWLYLDVQGFRTRDDVRWARGMFFFSLIALMGVLIAITLGA
jgi:heme o synthase